jgi:glycosyltransferase involved in cell wall biosynthesis
MSGARPLGASAPPHAAPARFGAGAPRVLLVEEGGRGGVSDYTAELAAALARAGWRADVATACDHAFPPTAGVTVHRVFPYVRDRRPAGRLLRRLGLSRGVNGIAHLAASALVVRLAWRCDVVHVQGEEWPPLGAVQALLLRALRRPVVYTPHNTFDRGERSYPRANALIRRCARRLVVHSEFDRSSLPDGLRAKTAVIPHGEYGGLARRGSPDVDPLIARTGLGAADDELVVLLFGQLRPDKGVRDLLEAAAEVPGVRIVLAGEDHGVLSQVAGLLTDTRLRDRVVVRPGFVPPRDAGSLFAASDLVVLPYHRASASGVLLLAYGYARPVLAYPVGGLPEYVEDGGTGWMCERADAASLAKQLRMIALAGRDECRARGDAGRRFSEERLSWSKIARRTTQLYEDALTSSARSAAPQGL